MELLEKVLKVPAKAGLITADEMVYAGALYNKEVTNNTTYLNNKTGFWTISPYSSDECYWDSIFLRLDYFWVDNPQIYSARPVLTLSADAIISSGDGSLDTPFVIG